MFRELEKIHARPAPFQCYTAQELWADRHTSKKMLEFHLHDAIDVASRNSQFIERSVEWIVSYCGVTQGIRIADFGCGPGLYTTRLAEKKQLLRVLIFLSARLIMPGRRQRNKD